MIFLNNSRLGLIHDSVGKSVESDAIAPVVVS
jgi:hypothetical protein